MRPSVIHCRSISNQQDPRIRKTEAHYGHISYAAASW